MEKRGRAIRILAAVLCASVAVVAFSAWRLASARPPAFHGTTFDEVAPAADFRLVDHTGRETTLASFRGRPVLLFFGYTHCPDICPLTLSRLTSAVRELGGRASDVRIVLVTVDPARDTPPVLAGYVRRFGPGVVGLTGDSAAVSRAMAGYGAYTLPPATGVRVGAAGPAHQGHPTTPGTGALGHSGVVYGIDRAGNLRVVITEGAPADKLKDDVRTLARL
jgi:protein SCO1/2